MGPLHHLLFLIAFLLLAAASSADGGAVSSVCSSTPNPSFCLTAASHYSGKYRPATIDARAVLHMQIHSTMRRAKAAKVRATQIAKTSPRAVAAGLNLCSNLYVGMLDSLGAAKRAGKFGDKALINIMFSTVLQNIVSCDYAFTKVGLKSPMARLDVTLTKMTNNCIALNNMA